jgi:hypothetical protein
MTDQQRDPELVGTSSSESPPRMPRWVKVAAIVVGVLLLLFVVAQLTGLAGEHGPGRHLSGHAPAPTSTWLAQPAPFLF